MIAGITEYFQPGRTVDDLFRDCFGSSSLCVVAQVGYTGLGQLMADGGVHGGSPWCGLAGDVFRGRG